MIFSVLLCTSVESKFSSWTKDFSKTLLFSNISVDIDELSHSRNILIHIIFIFMEKSHAIKDKYKYICISHIIYLTYLFHFSLVNLTIVYLSKKFYVDQNFVAHNEMVVAELSL